MRNRDYFTRPIQSGGRTAHDYGHNRIERSTQAGSDMPWWIGLAVLAAGIVWQLVR